MALVFAALIISAAAMPPNIPPGVPDLSPTWPATWLTKDSSYLYTCNWRGLVDPSTVLNWSILSLDWSASKWGPTGWAASKPMDNEERLFADAVNLVAHARNASSARAWVYRNSCKALPWFKTVREKLESPAHSRWFLSYGKTPPNAGAYFSPPCDPNYDPPLCSTLYHDSTLSPDYTKLPNCAVDGDCSVQVPGFPFGDGNCSAPACDTGAVPVGEYVFDMTAWNVSVNGQTLGQWWINEYLFGELGAMNPNITGFYFDDKVTGTNGCSELDSHQVADLGLSPAEMQAQADAYAQNFKEVYTTVVSKGAYTEQQFSIERPPRATGGAAACAASLRTICGAPPPPSLLVVFDDDTPLLSMAFFLLVRGPYSYFGHQWRDGCAGVPGSMTPPVPAPGWFPELFDVDHGEPVEQCHETAPSSGVFSRAWTHAAVSIDCNAPGLGPAIALHA
jgi:hypothetical protein